MALDTFTFAIELPPGQDSLEMFREVSGLMCSIPSISSV